MDAAVSYSWQATCRFCAEGAEDESEGGPAHHCGSPKDRPNVVGAIRGDMDRSAKGILDARPIGIRTRNV